MPPATTIIISLFGALVSALIGGVTVWLAIRKRLEEDALGRATRRTTALQLLSEEECTLEQVHDECVAMHTIVTVKADTLGDMQSFLLGETDRVISEAQELLGEVRSRRQQVEAALETLSPVALESVIATAYHGKKRAEAQLARTRLSRTEVLKAYGV